MKPSEVIHHICNNLEGVKPKLSWGETSLFYNPDNVLPNGVYFCTIKEQNGDNDQASELDRIDVYRIAIGLSLERYKNLFGQKPTRPSKGNIVSTGHDFKLQNELMPHPIYAWMSWAQVLSPTHERFEEIYPLIVESHNLAITKFNKKIASKVKNQDSN